jgi:endogenous inhibitor of DNA gyrase (YacG/DUF329 family)
VTELQVCAAEGCTRSFPSNKNGTRRFCSKRCTDRDFARRHGVEPLSAGPARQCVICGIKIAWLLEPTGLPSQWLPTAAICPHHLDLAHCLEHCSGE